MVNFEKPVPRKVPNIELLRLANYTNSFINENKELATIVETLFQRFFRLLKKLEVPSGFARVLYALGLLADAERSFEKRVVSETFFSSDQLS